MIVKENPALGAGVAISAALLVMRGNIFPIIFTYILLWHFDFS